MGSVGGMIGGGMKLLGAEELTVRPGSSGLLPSVLLSEVNEG